MMVETIEKATLLEKVQGAYEHLNTLLATLSEEQKTTPGVNGSWSVKDTLAHITAWQDLLPDRFQSWIVGQEPVEFLPEFKTEDEVNVYLYQQNKDRPLSEVEAAFQSSYRRAFAAVEEVREEALNTPVKSKSESRSALVCDVSQNTSIWLTFGDGNVVSCSRDRRRGSGSARK